MQKNKIKISRKDNFIFYHYNIFFIFINIFTKKLKLILYFCGLFFVKHLNQKIIIVTQ